ncbi:MAG: hypothetical protein ACI3VN_02100 [Candidatus Onthomonas sp.]
MTRRETGVRIWSLPASPANLPWLLLPLAFLLGGGGGHLLAGIGAESLSDLLESYSATCLTQGVTETDLPAFLWRCLRPMLLALVLSFSALGVLGLPLLLGIQGFYTGYVISGLARTWGLPGLGAAALWVGVEDLILLALLLAISIPGWARAWELATQTRLSRRMSPGYGRRCCLFCFAGLVLLMVYEYLLCKFITPALWARL